MKKIACIGNITYDIMAYTNGYPTENTRHNYDNIIETVGGPTVNASLVLNKFNENVDFYGIVGKDTYGEKIIKELKNSKINLDNLFISEKDKTSLSFIVITDETRTINTYRNKINNINFNYKENEYNIILTDGKYYDEYKTLKSKNPNATTIIDAGRVNLNVINSCKITDYIICSEDFANDLLNNLGYKTKLDVTNYNSIENVFNIISNYFSNSILAITVGEHGYIYKSNNVIKLVPPIKIDKVVDTNAAGDIFHGAFAYGMNNNFSYEESLNFANITSSLSVTKKGGNKSCPTLTEIKKILENQKNKKVKKLKK